MNRGFRVSSLKSTLHRLVVWHSPLGTIAKNVYCIVVMFAVEDVVFDEANADCTSSRL